MLCFFYKSLLSQKKIYTLFFEIEDYIAYKDIINTNNFVVCNSIDDYTRKIINGEKNHYTYYIVLNDNKENNDKFVITPLYNKMCEDIYNKKGKTKK